MPARKTPSVAYGEYVPKEPSSADLEERRNREAHRFQKARRALMETVREYFPEMLERLATDVLPAYADWQQESANPRFTPEAILFSKPSPFKALTQDSSLRTALWKWATEFHAEQDWFLDEMLRTLRGWHVAPDWRSELRCNPIGQVTTIVARGGPFSFACEPWEMQTCTWTDYRHSLLERFDQYLNEYQATCRTLAESCNLDPVQPKVSPDNLRWFALYQFKELPYREIALQVRTEAFGEKESGIRKGVTAAQRLIGWDSLRSKPRPWHRKVR